VRGVGAAEAYAFHGLVTATSAASTYSGILELLGFG